MYSDNRNRCSHRLGFPIRKSPDRRLLASPRGLSQLTTSFFACLRQGIHTHALSSLTIKSNSHTQISKYSSLALVFCPAETCQGTSRASAVSKTALLVVNNARQIFDCQRSDSFGAAEEIENPLPSLTATEKHLRFLYCCVQLFCFAADNWWAWVDSNYRPHPYQGCALTN